jgi:SAM-dependent methyltransferase
MHRSADLYDLRTQSIESDRESIGARTTLEVGCGTGRVVRWLLECGAPSVVGVDIDADKIAIAHSRFGADSRVALIHGDFLTEPIPGTYERVLFAFNVIAEFAQPEVRIRALKRASQLLTADGLIVVMAQMHDFEAFAKAVTRHEIYLRDARGNWRTTIECIRDEARQLSRCSVQYVGEQTQEVVTDQYLVSLLTRNELLACYWAADLAVAAEYGSHRLDPLTEKSSELIHVLRPRHSPG